MSDTDRQNEGGLWDADEVAGYLKLSRRTIERRVSTRTIPFVRIGGLIRFRRADIDTWLATQTVPVTDEPDADAA